jgi:trehalose synthase-fused probable maltokinase
MATSYGTSEVSALASWLANRRWYGEKARELIDATTISHVRSTIESMDIEFELVRLAFSSGDDASYLLVRHNMDEDADGIEHDAVRAWVMNGFAEARSLIGDHGGRLQWIASAELSQRASEVASQSRVFRGEQSNTSMVFGDRVMVKLFRNLRPGVNPEVEIGNFLTAHTDFRAFPRLLGELDLELAGEGTTIAAVQEFIPSVGDAWGWITERIDDPTIHESTVIAAGVLGQRTGELHVAFSTGEAPAFVPEQADRAHAESVLQASQRELRQTVDDLRRAGIEGAEDLGSALETALAALLELDRTVITRIHGDYHLGQVLRTEDDDFAILDFEGEPARSLEERRAKASPLRDVAGMLRSFDYAAETARRSPRGMSTTDVDSWYRRSRDAFLDGYFTAIVNCEILQRGWTDQSRASVLAAFEVHKALYEVRYELSNRPDWLDIPLNALRRLAI